MSTIATTKEAVQLVGELPKLLAHGGFRRTTWVSNDKSIMYHVPTSEQASTVNLDLERPPQERALGVLSNAASFYDPLGLVHLWYYQLKVFFRNFVTLAMAGMNISLDRS